MDMTGFSIKKFHKQSVIILHNTCTMENNTQKGYEISGNI
jgi:hypothetical protein